jgi:hypothetical protein
MITLDKKLEEELERDKNWYKVILPKLHAIENGTNFTNIEIATNYRALLIVALGLSINNSYKGKVHNIHILSKHLDSAEKWLISITYKGVNNNE